MRPIVCLLGVPVLVAGALLSAGCDRQKASAPQAADGAFAPAATTDAARGVDRSHAGELAPTDSFKNPDGGDISLTAFKGLPVLVNLWASWCAPCVKELPTLDRFAATHRDDGQFAVIAVSQDMAPQASVAAFLAKLDLQDINAAYHDPEMKLTDALGIKTMPTTILYGRDGRELWRYVGDLDWTSAEASKLLAEAK